MGYGGMGKALAKLLTLAEHKVVITGRNSAKAEEAARESGGVYMPQSEALEWGDYVIWPCRLRPSRGTTSPA